MRIGELARQSGVNASTLRFYENQGLLPRAQRSGNGYRSYPPQALERVALIRLAQGLGFSLEQIRQTCGEPGAGLSHELVLAGLRQRLAEIDQLQRRLAGQREEIERMLVALPASWSAGQCLSLAEGLSQAGAEVAD